MVDFEDMSKLPDQHETKTGGLCKDSETGQLYRYIHRHPNEVKWWEDRVARRSCFERIFRCLKSSEGMTLEQAREKDREVQRAERRKYLERAS